MVNIKVLKPDTEKFLILILLAATVVLRFVNLSYSDYISDEPGTFFYRGGKKNPEMSVQEFILSQRKGPLQLFVGYIPYLIVGNYNNELAQRLPFAIFSVLSILIFYLMVKKLTSNTFISFVSAFLLSVNGLLVGYGRIAQYQNLNLFFSFLSVYFYSDVLNKSLSQKQKLLKTSLGSVFFALSFYAHWDAIYYLIPVIFLFLKFFCYKDVSLKDKAQITLVNILISIFLILPFLGPYIKYNQSLPANVKYANSILGLGDPFAREQDLKQFILYNPFLTLYVYLIGGTLGLLLSWKNKIFSFWFIVLYLFFSFFVKYWGLHFYNLFIPIVILIGFTANFLLSLFPKKLKFVPLIAVFSVLSFLFWQSYVLFVDHTQEYPVERKKVLYWKTFEYSHKDDLRHKTGFPHKRYWKEINDFVNEQNKSKGESLGYTTNEYPQIAKFYMESEFRGGSEGYYAIGIKRPQSFANDYSFPQLKNKHTVHKIVNESGDTVVRIYRVDEE